MFCTECGEEYVEVVNFCSKCGADLTLYPDTNPDLNPSGSLDVVQSSVKKNSINLPEISKEDSIRDDKPMIGHTPGGNESAPENPGNSWEDEKEHMECVISQLEYENQKLREEKEKLTKPRSRGTNPPKKSGLPRPQIKSSESMWNKFKKWYNE
ncbi:zinc-ribbon domain-containing protein [Methanobacterium sp.]|uniref:zinc ribbon domain-containing protein n=1 Tax=Methanobacterium sp. TaxID=2164 RepID=UPI0025ED5BD8|nr:zinc-ribbon domain-containing protein [Methanobacterium sp.]MBI5460293.1 zinc-ribbon domain-containing protein [Methanobacterium sp.]